MTMYRIMMRTETGEEVRACDETFNNEDSADDMCEILEPQHPECTLWVEREDRHTSAPYLNIW
jgi:hypothetical protein